MWNHKWVIVTALMCFHCGGSGSSAPAKEPTSEAQPEATSEEKPEAKPPAGESGEKPASGGENKATGGGAGGGEKKACKELDKSTCKVTMGCVWNDVSKCVEESSNDQ